MWALLQRDGVLETGPQRWGCRSKDTGRDGQLPGKEKRDRPSIHGPGGARPEAASRATSKHSSATHTTQSVSALLWKPGKPRRIVV